MLPIVATVIIIAGIILIISSIEVRKVEVIDKKYSPTPGNQKVNNKTKEVKNNEDKKVLLVETEKNIEPVNSNSPKQELIEDIQAGDVSHTSGPILKQEEKSLKPGKIEAKLEKKHDDPSIFHTVLYEGEKRIFEENSESFLDESLKDCKRVGSGDFTLQDDSIIFKLERTTYRFDFNKIDKVKGQGPYILVFLKRLKTASLFIANNEEKFSLIVMKAYFSYKENHK